MLGAEVAACRNDVLLATVCQLRLVGHVGWVGICSRGQRVSPVIAVQWYPNESWVATWFARGNPVSRPKRLWVIYSYKGIVRTEAKKREFPHINGSCKLPASKVLSAQFGSAVSTVRCMALLRNVIATIYANNV